MRGTMIVVVYSAAVGETWLHGAPVFEERLGGNGRC